MFVYADDSPEYVDSEVLSEGEQMAECHSCAMSTEERLENIKAENFSLRIALERLHCKYQMFLSSNQLDKDVADTIFELERQLSSFNSQKSPQERQAIPINFGSFGREFKKLKANPTRVNISTQTIPQINTSTSFLWRDLNKNLNPAIQDENDVGALKEKLNVALQTVGELQSSLAMVDSKSNDILKKRVQEMERVIGEMDKKNKRCLVEIEDLRKENMELRALSCKMESLTKELADSEQQRKELEASNQELMQQNSQLCTDLSAFKDLRANGLESRSQTSPNIDNLNSPDNVDEVAKMYMAYCEELISCIFKKHGQNKQIRLEFSKRREDASNVFDLVQEAIRLQSESGTEILPTNICISNSVYDLVQIVKEYFAKLSQEMHLEHTELLCGLMKNA